MSIRTIALIAVALVAILGAFAWMSQMQKAEPPPASAPPLAQGEGQGQGTSIGDVVVEPPPADARPELAWNVPANWNALEARPMRLATYGIPALGGDAEGAECAVFYFGPTQGGGPEENIDRWVSQFENPGPPERSQLTIGDLPVWRLRVTGDYLASTGPSMEFSEMRKGYALLGAIVEGPNGRVFFKLTGPRKTVDGSRREFDNMLRTLKKS